MQRNRATEISESPVTANVTYNGKAVYIQHVDEDNETARIYPLDAPEQEQDVALRSLLEE